LYSVLSADVKDFEEFARVKYEEMRQMFPPEEEEPPE